MKIIEYQAQGVCIGRLWSFEDGAYPTIKFNNSNKDELYNEIEESVKSGSIDSGMGFESIRGALMTITTKTTITVDDKTFTNEESETDIFGKVSDDEIDYLEDYLLEV